MDTIWEGVPKEEKSAKTLDFKVLLEEGLTFVGRYFWIDFI